MGTGFSAELGKDSLLEETKLRLDRTLHLLRADDPDTVMLDISNSGLGVKGVEVGSPALAGNTCLKRLDLSYNDIGAEGIPALLEALQQNTALVGLNLAGNHIGDEGVHLLAEYLKANPHLEELSLYHNNISDKGVWELVNALQLNEHLIVVNLSMNNLTQKTLVMFRDLLKMNNTLSHLALSQNNINIDADPKKYAAIESDIRTALSANEERVHKIKHAEEIKAQKAARRVAKEEEERAAKVAEEHEESLRMEEEMKIREEQERKEAAEVQELEDEMARRQRMIEERRAQNDPEARAARAKEWQERAIEQAYSWREKLTLGGGFVKEWRNGFTVMTTRPGDKPGTSPSLSAEAPRRLKACWCDPQDATAPFAKTLHYHCKYEKEGESVVHKGDGEAAPKYAGCCGTGHTCATIGFYAKPLPNLSASNFFASQHPDPVNVEEDPAEYY